MKLLVEEINPEDTEVLEEDVNGKKFMCIKGIFLQSEIKNRNGRLYPKRILEKEVERYNKNYIDESKAYGECMHPSSPTIDLNKVSHLITELKADGNNFIGKARIFNTGPGKTVQAILEGGGKLGVSTRGMGTLKNVNGVKIVQEDFRLCTAADIVSDPSAPDAYVQAVMENKEWTMNELGEWTAYDIDTTKKILKEASRHDIEEIGLKIFTNFMSKISRN